MDFCTNCGERLIEGNAFCTKCGQKVPAPEMTPQSKTPEASGAPVPPIFTAPSFTPPYQDTPGSIPSHQNPTGNGPTYQNPTGNGSSYRNPTGNIPPINRPTGGNNGQNTSREPENNKKGPLVPILIAVGALLLIGIVILCIAAFGNKKSSEAGEETRRADRTTAASADRSTEGTTRKPTQEERSQDRPSEKSDSKAADRTTTAAPETPQEKYFNRAFLGRWYGDQRTVFDLYSDGTVDYYDGGVDGNRLKGNWTLDEDTGLFELDLYGGSNRFHLYAELSRGSDSTIMYRMAMDWSKSTTNRWFYETFYREPPARYQTDDEKVQQPYP